MPQQPPDYEEDLVLRLIKEALYSGESLREGLVREIVAMLAHHCEGWRGRLQPLGIGIREPDTADLSAAGEQVLERVCVFIRAMMGFSERSSRSHVRKAARLFDWSDMIEDRTVDPIIMYFAARLDEAAVSLTLAYTCESISGPTEPPHSGPMNDEETT
jgi:hypothetical protein